MTKKFENIKKQSTKIMKSKVMPFTVAAGLAGVIGLMDADSAFAHGYVQSPASRAYTGHLEKGSIGWTTAWDLYGAAADTPQGIEGKNGAGFPVAGPADGQLVSAGLSDYSPLDRQTSDAWIKNDMNVGVNDFTWYHTAPHSTTKYHYYITKEGWDPNKPITRDDLELIETIDYSGRIPAVTETHKVNIPNDRSGYHVVLAIWDIADTGHAFYQAIDVNVKNDSAVEKPDTEKPSAVTGLKATSVTDSSVNLEWNKSNDNVGVDHYVVYRSNASGEAKQIATVETTSYVDNNVEENSNYTYYVVAVDKAGNRSDGSNILTVSTPEKALPEGPDTEAPTKVTGLHTMEVTSNKVDLMWTASKDNVGVDHYEIYREDGTNKATKIGTSTKTSFVDQSVAFNTTYKYYVVAIDEAGNTSEASDKLTVTTKEETVDSGEEKPGVSDVQEWNAFGKYAAGDKVSYNGKIYEALVTFTGYGDMNWNPESALSLWKLVGDATGTEVETPEVSTTKEWSATGKYTAGDKVSYNGKTYEALVTFTGYGDMNWNPESALSLWKLAE